MPYLHDLINPTVVNVHVPTAHDSQGLTGTLKFDNPTHQTGKFAVVAFWSDGPTLHGRHTQAGTDYEEDVTKGNATLHTSKGFHIDSPTKMPTWARYVVIQIYSPDVVLQTAVKIR